MKTVERVGDHLFVEDEAVCSRCGVLRAQAEERPCVTSTVNLIPQDEERR